MSRGLDISGQKFGMLTAIRPAALSKNKTWKWECRCDCGVFTVVFITALRSGGTTSCGCNRGKNKTHGMTLTATYRTWKTMKARCNNSKSPDYKWYGAKGVTVCKRWTESFEAFLEDMGERPKGKTLDRIDSRGHYEPSNCRWATPKEQAQNRGASEVA